MQTATYNVNGKASSSVNLSDWLEVQPEPDIVAVGFQEIVPLTASNVVLGEEDRLHVLWLSICKASRIITVFTADYPGHESNGLNVRNGVLVPAVENTLSIYLAGASLEAAAGWDELIEKALNKPREHHLYQQVAARGPNQHPGLTKHVSASCCASQYRTPGRPLSSLEDGAFIMRVLTGNISLPLLEMVSCVFWAFNPTS